MTSADAERSGTYACIADTGKAMATLSTISDGINDVNKRLTVKSQGASSEQMGKALLGYEHVVPFEAI